jgi:hypothetical protein
VCYSTANEFYGANTKQVRNNNNNFQGRIPLNYNNTLYSALRPNYRNITKSQIQFTQPIRKSLYRSDDRDKQPRIVDNSFKGYNGIRENSKFYNNGDDYLNFSTVFLMIIQILGIVAQDRFAPGEAYHATHYKLKKKKKEEAAAAAGYVYTSPPNR